MMQSEKVASDLNEAFEASPARRRPIPMLSAAVRKLERRSAQAPSLVEPSVRALDAALVAIDEARDALEEAIRAAEFDPRELEQARSAFCAPRRRPQIRRARRRTRALRDRYESDVAVIDAGEERLAALEQALGEAERVYVAAAKKLSAGRRKAASALDKAVQAELPPLKLERAEFIAEIAPTKRAAMAPASTGWSSGRRPIPARARSAPQSGIRRRAFPLHAGA